MPMLMVSHKFDLDLLTGAYFICMCVCVCVHVCMLVYVSIFVCPT